MPYKLLVVASRDEDGGWKYYFEHERNVSIEFQLDTWVHILEDKVQALRERRSQGNYCRLSWLAASSATVSIVVPSELQSALALLRLDWEISIQLAPKIGAAVPGKQRLNSMYELATNEKHKAADCSIGHLPVMGSLHLYRIYPYIRCCAAGRLPERWAMALLRGFPADHVDREHWTASAGKKITGRLIRHDMVPAGTCIRSIFLGVRGRDVAGLPEKQCVIAGPLPPRA